MIISTDKKEAVLQDFHMHTHYCDGKNTPEQMIVSAIEKGLKTVGVCIHSYIDGDLQEYTSLEEEQEFYEKMQQAKNKYSDKIKVLCGIEWDYYTNQYRGEYDYRIGSLHWFQTEKRYYFIDRDEKEFLITVNELFNGDYYKMAEKYFEMVGDIVEKTNCDIIGHFDLITKYNEGNKHFDTTHPRYVNAYKKAIDKLIPYNKPFEINTGAISRGYRLEPYPSKDIIAYIKEKGGKLILSSDSHSTKNIAFEYDKWKHLLG